jgi:hypothetical protein
MATFAFAPAERAVRPARPRRSANYFLAALSRNPILERELRSRWRRPLTYVVLFFYAAALSWVAWSLSGTAMMQSALLLDGFESEAVLKLPGAGSVREQRASASTSRPVRVGAFVRAVGGARARAEDAARANLAGLSPAQIVRGKWLATLGFALILLLIPLPLQALAFLMGGVSPADWAGAALLQIGAMIFGSALGMWCSCANNRVSGAVGAALAGAALCSIPLATMMTLVPGHAWLAFLLAAGCVLCAIPVAAGAQEMLRQTPLDPPRPPAAIDLPSSPGEVPQPFAPGTKAHQNSNQQQQVLAAWSGEQPESPEPLDSREGAEEAEWVASAAARKEVRDWGAKAARGEPWLFGLLRALKWHDPLVWRELRVRLRAPFFEGQSGLVALLCLLAVPHLLQSLFWQPGGTGFGVMVGCWVLCGGACALRASQGFTREREQKMLESLLLSTMSPWAIVRGKVAAPILLTAYAGAIPLAFFVLWAAIGGLSTGPAITCIALAGAVCFAVLGASCGAWLSFWCRTSSVAAVGSLSLFAGLLVVPLVLSSVDNRAINEWVERFWLRPLWWALGRMDGSFEFFAIGLLICALVLGVSWVFLNHVARALRPRALDREGRSLLHTDLTRNLH